MQNNVEISNDEILLIDKPAGMSSFSVVGKVRWVLSREASAFLGNTSAGNAGTSGDAPTKAVKKRIKVGHTGTLDPFATGLLILLVGKGTKRCGEFLKLDKEYIAKICLGKVSTTGDPEGEISATETNKIPTMREILNVAKELTGEIMQKVPEYSAVKINGQRAYKLAREGKKVEMPVKKVTIYEIEVLNYEWPELTVRTKVSSGTYIRQLAMDMGEELGVGAYVTELRRTQVGKYRIEEAETLDGWLKKRECVSECDGSIDECAHGKK